ncbi:hypothetical protein H9P43_006135 [Blastocladiella emersonii ATCC 22665]|nr:hypothetical protein H9P43_006135 [Blastocladiella emersonii ATCC 22665]
MDEFCELFEIPTPTEISEQLDRAIRSQHEVIKFMREYPRYYSLIVLEEAFDKSVGADDCYVRPHLAILLTQLMCAVEGAGWIGPQGAGWIGAADVSMIIQGYIDEELAAWLLLPLIEYATRLRRLGYIEEDDDDEPFDIGFVEIAIRRVFASWRGYIEGPKECMDDLAAALRSLLRVDINSDDDDDDAPIVVLDSIARRFVQREREWVLREVVDWARADEFRWMFSLLNATDGLLKDMTAVGQQAKYDEWKEYYDDFGSPF